MRREIADGAIGINDDFKMKPVLDQDNAAWCIGFAGITDTLFAADNSLMFFGSAKEAVLDLVAAFFMWANFSVSTTGVS